LRSGSSAVSLRSIGKVKSYNILKGFGFIDCPELKELYGRDVFLHRIQKELSGAEIGEMVEFDVIIDARQVPQSKNVRKYYPKKSGTAVAIEDAWVAFEAEEQQEVRPPKRQVQPPKPQVQPQDMRSVVWAEADIPDDADPWAEAPSGMPRDVAPATVPLEEVPEAVWAAMSEEEEDPWAELERLKAAEANPRSDWEDVVFENVEQERVETRVELSLEQETELVGLDKILVNSLRFYRRQSDQMRRELEAEGAAQESEFGTRADEFGKLERLVRIYDELLDASRQLEEAELLARDRSELSGLAAEELPTLRENQAALVEQIEVALLPRAPEDDAKRIILEINSGVGGDEAAIWTDDLLNMYTKYCESEGLEIDILDLMPSEFGGISNVQVGVTGDLAYTKLKFESGVHRVQRVPLTEKAGRVHTSTATVLVLPEIEDVKFDVPMKELEFQYCRAGGPGGQNVNKLETAVHCTHIPSGMHVFARVERTQGLNKALAIRFIKAKLLKIEQDKSEFENRDKRSGIMSSTGRSSKIRSYNYKENRVTDHRLSKSFPLDQILLGGLKEATQLMRALEQQERVEDLKRSLEKQAVAA